MCLREWEQERSLVYSPWSLTGVWKQEGTRDRGRGIVNDFLASESFSSSVCRRYATSCFMTVRYTVSGLAEPSDGTVLDENREQSTNNVDGNRPCGRGSFCLVAPSTIPARMLFLYIAPGNEWQAN